MTLVGFKKMTARILDGETNATLDTNLFTVEGKTGKGATQKVDIKGLAGDSLKAYGSNIAYYTSRKGVGDVVADFEVLDLPFTVREKLLGYVKKNKLTFIGADTEAPFCSVLLESEDLGGNPVYLGFVKGNFKVEEMSAETLKDKPDEPAPDKLSFSALAGDDGDAAGQYVVYYVGKEEQEITKLKTLLKMLPTG